MVASSATPEGYREEFARRVDAVVTLGAYKSDVADILQAAARESSYRMAIGAQMRSEALQHQVRERLTLRDGVVTSWMAREIMAFVGRGIDALASGYATPETS